METTLELYTTLFSRNDLTLNSILDSLCCNDIEEACLVLNDVFECTIDQETVNYDIFQQYHVFLYSLIENCPQEDLMNVKVLIEHNLKAIKNVLRDYNKSILVKDSKFRILKRTSLDLKASLNYFEDYYKTLNFSDNYNTLYHFIFNIKKPDYLFWLFELYPDYINLRDNENNHIFIKMVEHVNANIDELSDEEVQYFKRVFVMFLESDNFMLNNDELFDLLANLEKNKRSLDVNKKKHINFFMNEINKHYQVINAHSRMNVIDYCNRACPIEIVKRKNDERTDLTNLFTVSIDKVNKDEVGNILIDDAISLVEHNTGMAYDLYLHFPDVDYFVKKDSETDQFMRNLGENVYTRGYKTRMLPYEIAGKCSLTGGKKRNAITVKILITKEGEVLDVEFLKSIINVNYNLTKRKAEMFMGNTTYKDQTLRITLCELAELAKKIRARRGEKKGKNTRAALIIEEYNIFADLVVANFFNKSGIIFPYRIFEGKRDGKTLSDLESCSEFIKEHQINDENIALINEVLLANNRTYYDTTPKPNKSFKGAYAGNVGNPLREYISLETDRLIKDLIINGQTNFSYWEERIERDCIEYTETSAKINQLKRLVKFDK